MEKKKKKHTFTLIYMNLVHQYNHTKTLASKTIHILKQNDTLFL